MNAGSWVTPQLAVVLYHLDPNLVEGIRSRVEKGCEVSPLVGLNAVESHSATGPGSSEDGSAKLMATLLELARRIPELDTWIDSMLEREEVKALLQRDLQWKNSASLFSN